MDPANGEPDVLGKIDALLTRHRTGAPTRQYLASIEAQVARAAIPVLTEIIAEDGAIPVLTEAVPAFAATIASTDDGKPSLHIDTTASELLEKPTPVTEIAHNDTVLRQIEELMVRELEKRIALEFTAILDRTLKELLDHSREHIRLAVRVALKQRLDNTPANTPPPPL
jgi:hypothetical protein